MKGGGSTAALLPGAQGAQLGTASITCPDLATGGYKAALVGPAAWHTVMASLISRRLARALANRFTALADWIE